MRSRISVVAAVAALAGVVFLAGCGEDEGQVPLDESTMDGLASSMGSNLPSSDEASAEPTEEETFDPAKETARQFVKRWTEASAEMQETGDVSEFQELYDETCTSCARLVKDVRSILNAGGYVKVQPSRVVEMERVAENQWTVRFRSDGTEVRRSEHAEVQKLPGGEYTFTVFMYRDENRAWRLSNYTQDG